MATDARNHTVPAASGHPARADILSLALGIRDLIPVANTTARAAVITAMASAGVSVSTSNPVFVYRADARPDSAIEVTTDGTTWKTIVIGTGLQTFTPALTASGTNPTMGTGATAAGEYEQFGDYVIGTGEIAAGSSGFSAGAGSYRVNLPIAAASTASVAGRVMGEGIFIDATGNFYHLLLAASTSTTCTLSLDNGALLTSTTPVVPAVTDQWRYKFQYRAA